jgi:transcriptional regulator with XRE-family HTH domain
MARQPTPDDMARGARIEESRKALGLTQVQLAEKLAEVFPAAKIDQPKISSWERGVARPTVDQLFPLARFLGTTTDWLLSGQPDPTGRLDDLDAAVKRIEAIVTELRELLPGAR